MNPKIINFYPSKDSGNFLGFCALQIHMSLDGQLVPIVTKARVMRNGNTGHIFITLHQEAYKKQDGSTGYSNLIRIPEGKFNAFNKATEKAWDEFVSSKTAASKQSDPQKMGSPNPCSAEYYPHGMARNTQTTSVNPGIPSPPKQYKDNDEEDFR